ncbi:MAG: NUDIX hydrolase [Cetobacterium sp.]|uniref:NUDIX hydrolase n=1 Tax=Cetobacterium TaxID=180162 RepID=UPI001F05827B|nr:NUDIX hydrolase [Cetobacterium somerae]MCX3066866.1 NUDIX hydrolase [Cetobacterium somerae]UPO98330.1 NUDIX hydrolase [Cetobacterium somerae]
MKINDLRFLKVKIEKHPTRDIQLEFLDKPNAIAALILNFKEDKVLLVEQYRPGVSGKLLEIPAGIIENNEDPIQTLAREVREETGYMFESFEVMYTPKTALILSPGYTSEKLYVYILKLKTEKEKTYEKQLDEGEDLEVLWENFEKVESITNDFKTHYAITLYKNLIKK